MSLIHQSHRLAAQTIHPATDRTKFTIQHLYTEYSRVEFHRDTRLRLTKNQPSSTEFWQDARPTALILCREHIPESRAGPELSIDVANNMALDICQPEVSTRVAIGKPLVVQPHQVQNCGVQIMNVNFVLGGIVSVIIR